MSLIIPLITLLCGIVASLLVPIKEPGRGGSKTTIWHIHVFCTGLALVQQILLFKIHDVIFLTGNLINDSLTQALCLCLLVLGLFVHLARPAEANEIDDRVHTQFAAVLALAVLSIQSNKIIVGIIGMAALMFLGMGTLITEDDKEKQPEASIEAATRAYLVGLLGICIFVVLLSTFGRSQVDEVRRLVIHPDLDKRAVRAIQVFLLFWGALFLGLPPLFGFWNRFRRRASWSLAGGITLLFMFVGFSVIWRWGIFMFTRPNLDGTGLDPVALADILPLIKYGSGFGLVLIPILALFEKRIKMSIMILLANPFVQSLYVASMGIKIQSSHSLAHVLMTVPAAILLISSAIAMGAKAETTFTDWRMDKRPSLEKAVAFLLALGAYMGFAPFFGGYFIENALRLNSTDVLLLLVNLVFCGLYLGWVATSVFGAGAKVSEGNPIVGRQKLILVAQGILLFLMGIFVDPLYKFGARAVKQFFGES